MEYKVKQNVDEHMVKYKDKIIIRQHIKNKPIKLGSKMWCRCTPNTSYLYAVCIYTYKKETA